MITENLSSQKSIKNPSTFATEQSVPDLNVFNGHNKVFIVSYIFMIALVS